ASDKEKIFWASSYLRQAAHTWWLNYERVLKNAQPGEGFAHDQWDYFVEKLVNTYATQDRARESILKIEALKYKGSIADFVAKVEDLNTYAGLKGAAFQNSVLKGLPADIINRLSLMEGFSSVGGNDRWTEEEFLASLQMARLGYEAVKSYAIEAPTHNPGQAQKLSNGKGKNKENPSKNNHQAGKKEPANSSGKPKPAANKDYPKRFATFEKATKGVPRDLVDKRRKKKRCAHYGLNHDTLYCAKEISVAASAIAAERKKKRTSSDGDSDSEGDSGRSSKKAKKSPSLQERISRISSVGVNSQSRIYEADSDEESTL